MVKQVTVSFNYLADDSVLAVTVDRSTSSAALRQLWEERSGFPSANNFFSLDSGRALPKDTRLDEILPPRAFLLGIVVEPRAELSVSVVGFPAMSWSFSFGLHTTVGDVLNDARSRLRLGSPSLKLRLLLNGKAVGEEDKIEGHKHQSSEDLQAIIDIEVHFATMAIRPLEFHAPIFFDENILVTDESDLVPAFDKSKEDCLRRMRCFLSENSSVLMDCRVPVERQRITSMDWKRTATATATIASLLSDEEVLNDSCVYLFNEMVLPLFLVRRGKPCKIMVWPTNRASELLNGNERLLIDNEPVENPDQSFLELGLQQGAVISVADLITVNVLNSRGRLNLFDVDWDMYAADFRQLVDSCEEDLDYQLLCDGWSIERKEMRSLRSLGVRPNSHLRTHFDSRLIEFVLGDRVVPVGAVRTSTSFPALLRLASEHLGSPLPPDSRFLCACGRIISDENPQRRSIPSGCCEEAVLSLKVEVPVDFEAAPSGSFAELSCRLPQDASPELLERLGAALKPVKSREMRRRTEAILRSILRLQGARNVFLRLPEGIDFVVNVAGDKLPWSAAPSTPLSSVLRAVRKRCYMRRAVDFSVRRGRRLGLSARPQLTLEGAAICEGQELKLELPKIRNQSTQTASASLWLTSIGLQTKPLLRSRGTQTVVQKAETPIPIPTPRPPGTQTAVQKVKTPIPIPTPRPPDVARFCIVCNWHDGGEFELSIPVLNSGVDVATLRAEVIVTAPKTRTLRQRRGRRQLDDALVVQTDFGNFAGRDGELVRRSQVDRKEEVVLYDSDPLLLVPGRHRIWIWADN